jgi:hypothetical protein
MYRGFQGSGVTSGIPKKGTSRKKDDREVNTVD